MNCNFNLRNPKSESETAIHLIIRWSGFRLVYPTHLKINPKNWQSVMSKKNYQRAKRNNQFPQYPEFNTRLDYISSESKSIFRKFQNDNKHQNPSKEMLKELLDEVFSPDYDVSAKTLIGFIEQFIVDSSTRINPRSGKPISEGTIKSYRNVCDRLKEYKLIKKKRIDFDTITIDFYDDFKRFMILEKDYAVNTIGRYINTLITLLNEATERGLNTNMTYKSKRFVVDKEETENIFLNDNELEDIYLLDLSKTPKLENARDLFLIGCYTGLRFSDFQQLDLSKLTKENILEVRQKKTQKRLIIPFYHPVVLEIKAKYEGKTFNSLPRAISNQKLNKYIKEVGALVKSLYKKEDKNITKGGIKIILQRPKYKCITTHTARRSFASNLILKGKNIFDIMQATGHQSEKDFRNYVKIEPRDKVKRILKLYENVHLRKA